MSKMVSDIEAQLNKIRYPFSAQKTYYRDLSTCVQNFNLVPSRARYLKELKRNNVNTLGTSYILSEYTKDFNENIGKFNATALKLKSYYQNISKLSCSIDAYCSKPGKIRGTVTGVTNLAQRDNEAKNNFCSSFTTHLINCDDKLRNAVEYLGNIYVGSGSINLIDPFTNAINDIRDQIKSIDKIVGEMKNTTFSTKKINF